MSSAQLHTTDNGVGVDSNVPHVVLGQHSYALYAQRHAYLTNRLGRAFAELQATGGFDADTFEGAIAALGDRAYDLLKVFIPKLMPRYEFSGYPTQEAYDAHDYNDEYDHSPTFPELVNAFQLALKVNRLDVMGNLGKVINMDLAKAYINKALIEFMEGLESRKPQNFSLEEGTSD